jgi:hypothetical protein
MSKQRFVIGIAILVSLAGLYFYKSAAMITLGCTTAITLAIFNAAPKPNAQTAVIKNISLLQRNP